MNRSRAMLGLVGSEPRSEIMSVTPEMAAKWLSNNTATNRPISLAVVDSYARDMAAGRWDLTHQGIAFNQTGELVDGQHRLAAIVRSGATVRTVVSTGFAVEYNSPLDQGRLRTLNHVLRREHRWVAAVRVLYVLSEGTSIGNSKRRSLGDIQAAYDMHRSVVDEVWATTNKSIHAGVTAAVCWAFPFMPQDALSFAVQVRDGERLERGDPAYALRVWLERGSNRKNGPTDTALATLSCLRALYEGNTLANVHTGRTGYLWSCGKRRAAKVPGTPKPDVAPTRANP